MKQDPKHASVFWMGLVLIAALCLALPFPASAHAPKDVKLEMDAGRQHLKVTITHNSSFPSWHYIKLVQISKNGAIVSTNEYHSQPDRETFEYTYPLEVATGDVIEVTASCSISGSKSVKLTINSPPKTP